jgi:hypothetical protein
MESRLSFGFVRQGNRRRMLARRRIQAAVQGLEEVEARIAVRVRRQPSPSSGLEPQMSHVDVTEKAGAPALQSFGARSVRFPQFAQRLRCGGYLYEML